MRAQVKGAAFPPCKSEGSNVFGSRQQAVPRSQNPGSITPAVLPFICLHLMVLSRAKAGLCHVCKCHLCTSGEWVFFLEITAPATVALAHLAQYDDTTLPGLPAPGFGPLGPKNSQLAWPLAGWFWDWCPKKVSFSRSGYCFILGFDPDREHTYANDN